MSEWLRFTNQGKVDVLGIRLMGCSSKRDQQGKIGLFGTGWKYALALLLRLKAEVWVFSGTELVTVEIKKVSFRGKELDEVWIDGTASGFTTELGPLWETWMAVRELYCNALDEGKAEMLETSEEPQGSPGETRVYVEMTSEVRQTWEQRDNWFITPGERVIWKDVKSRARIFRQGILVFESGDDSRFNYSLDDCRINEERMADFWNIRATLLRLLEGDCTPRQLRALLEDMPPFEATLASEFFTLSREEKWEEALEDRTIATDAQIKFHGNDLLSLNPLILPCAWFKILTAIPSIRTAESIFRARSRAKMATGDRHLVDQAIKLLRKYGVMLGRDDVCLAQFEDEKVLGKVEDEMIHVSHAIKDMHTMVKVLMHEWIHRRTETLDCSRDFEDAQDDVIAGLILRGRAT